MQLHHALLEFIFANYYLCQYSATLPHLQKAKLLIMASRVLLLANKILVNMQFDMKVVAEGDSEYTLHTRSTKLHAERVL